MEGGMASYPVATPKSRCRRGRIGVQPSPPSPQRRSQVVGPFPLARGLSQVRAQRSLAHFYWGLFLSCYLCLNVIDFLVLPGTSCPRVPLKR
ncbi:uncharacterized protein LOC126946626 isoform X4 [Macaca thibetana thibetana]|uniref:uncharacterized protein LOC126946626 isoform X3 n=1 Tax=Macaca thibetana thibetana TaxID=257877 RepID=UPI0021BCC894|nr:uncharacterized protein LOC126946626 isoform X3 [Macaca thibetana thibetana]XP_050633145.1 uncharacterized protein LOC126946626 isoform X4 [Macaca thibetana thibetana]